ncbi:MAG: GNAT family N-acetyltransferase [Prolixibacteraceae bacterium]|nr:GNAT family N-acetyltransferase [Prolixibacteraceae bacterium]
MPENSRIRDAQPEDAELVSLLLVEAMGDLVPSFTSGANSSDQVALFKRFFTKKNNQYSYENTVVYEDNGEILGSANGYKGDLLKSLRTDFIKYLKDKFGFVFPDNSDETGPGEFYIDCLCVFNEFRNQGIGSSLINAMIKRAKSLNIDKIGLLVDISNTNALKLYQNLGFEIVEKKFFINDFYYHMQKEITSL